MNRDTEIERLIFTVESSIMVTCNKKEVIGISPIPSGFSILHTLKDDIEIQLSLDYTYELNKVLTSVVVWKNFKFCQLLKEGHIIDYSDRAVKSVLENTIYKENEY